MDRGQHPTPADAIRRFPAVECLECKVLIALIVKGREQLERVGLLLVVVDEDGCFVRGDHSLDFFHRCDGFRAIRIEGGHDVVPKVFRRMGDITRQDDEAGFFQVHQQRLAAGGVPGCGDQNNASVTEYVGVTVE